MSKESIETGLDETELDGDLAVDEETASQVAGGFMMIEKRELKSADRERYGAGNGYGTGR